MQDNTLTVLDKTTGRENQKHNGKPHNPPRTKAKKVRKKSDHSQKRSDWKPSVKEQQPIQTRFGLVLVCVSHINNHVGQMAYLVQALGHSTDEPPVW